MSIPQDESFGSEQDVDFVLRDRPQPMPGQFRTVRRVALLAVMLKACRASQASLPQLHVLNWAVRTKESRRTFIRYMTGDIEPDQAIVRYDPTLPRAIQYAVAEGIVTDRQPQQDDFTDNAERPVGNYRISLTQKGEELAESVAEAGLIVEERLFLDGLGAKISQATVQSLFDWGRA